MLSLKQKQGIIQARSSIAMIVGLLLAFGLIAGLELWDASTPRGGSLLVLKPSEKIPSPPTLVRLSPVERRWAQIAWRYFENNYQAETGLVNSTDNYPSTTMWDTASYLMALASAYRLDIISHHVFDEKVSLALSSLGRLELFDGQLPNKSYNARTLAMTDYDNKPSPRGTGWSAIDLGRLLVPLHIIAWNHPEHFSEVRRIMDGWKWSAMAKGGQLMGAVLKDGRPNLVQEGRLGYEQYAARAASLQGLDVSIAMNASVHLSLHPQYGIDVPADIRDAERLDAHNYVVSEPYILDGLEFGGGWTTGELAWRVYRVQEERWRATSILTAVSEDHLDQPPYFVYNSVFVNGTFWKAITDDGRDMEQFKSLSTKAAFGWHALYRTNYTDKLIKAVRNLNDPERGWYSGLYEKNGKPNRSVAVNTNGIVLESLAAMQFGRLIDCNDK